MCRLNADSVAPNAASFAAIAALQLNRTALALLAPPGSRTIALLPTVTPADFGSSETAVLPTQRDENQREQQQISLVSYQALLLGSWSSSV